MFLQMFTVFTLLVKAFWNIMLFMRHIYILHGWFLHVHHLKKKPSCFYSQYANVVQALKRGDPRLLRQALQEHEDR